MKTYCRRMDISGENFIRKYIAAFIYDKLENGNMPSIFAYYGSISKMRLEGGWRIHRNL